MDNRAARPPIGPESQGLRVTVRRRLPDGSATDVVGRVLEAGPPVTVETRTGELVRIDPATVLLWRVVPDRPLRRRPAARVPADDLQRITSRGWPAVESAALGDWELRASSGFTQRANSVDVHGDPGVGAGEASAAVTGFYRARHLPPLAQVVSGSSWERRLVDLGWRATAGERAAASVQVLDLAAGPVPDPEVRVEPLATDAWLARYPRVGDPAVARRVLQGPARVRFLHLDEAICRVVVTGEWAGVSAVEVPAARRRRGLGRRIVLTALAWAASEGADKAYLQTTPDNAPALGLWADLGFHHHHGYRYLTTDGP
ncbi:acetyltransferase, GNAT family [Aeromicrobium marinum DSM 15272]|uniref:Acetyltransferase, GNAT family n=1 Tax=Aeromicrobium marinum DSM 15272 TaxID=585531 RepID=E2SE56_9ACTN|nr:GNAT family N-acetyltransferase [Aeromicrobium marinum]EFQ82783.1 acetyltransferase, GNAT family [Aeromicrobium marinum DSM 15272]